jgi:hypothetical protein
MGRLVVALLVGVAVAVMVYRASESTFAATVVGAFFSAAVGVLAFGKELLSAAKGWYDFRAARQDARERKRLIVQPTGRETRRYGTPLRGAERDLLADYRKETQFLSIRPFVVHSEEQRDDEKDRKKKQP